MTMMTITFGQDFKLNFKLEPTEIAELWLSRMRQRHQWPLDDPERFYGFGSSEQEKNKATKRLRDCIQTINGYQHIIQREFVSIDDQDMLNYLHNIFERYHGLLDQQNTNWWRSAPSEVQKALANLNLSVHRAESAIRSNRPRLVCTWFGMPKDYELTPDQMHRHGRLSVEFGGVYLNYVEIGKTLEDLSIDDDHWIGDDAFQPMRHYSADFKITFFDSMADVARIYRYFEKNQDFFKARGIMTWDDYRTKPYRYKVACLATDLSNEEILSRLSKNQLITDIYLE